MEIERTTYNNGTCTCYISICNNGICTCTCCNGICNNGICTCTCCNGICNNGMYSNGISICDVIKWDC